jgi:hemerythrin-like domain-containing protein
MNKNALGDRRMFINAVGRLGTSAIAAGSILLAQEKSAERGKKKDEKPEEVGPTEDLMREHGVLNRVLVVYENCIYRIEQKQDFKPEVVTSAANVIRKFVEDYHERQEEQFLFPRFEKAGILTDLVRVLKIQHEAGRSVTDRVSSLAKSRGADDRPRLAHALRQFVGMYRPHEAREDTVLFPELRNIVTAHEFDALGEQFETNEHKQFGADGFELYRDKGAELEKELGVYDLARFTPTR